MRKVLLALGLLALSILACTQAGVTATPVPTVANTKSPVPTVTPAPSATLEARTESTATILKPVVNIHAEPDGTVIGYVIGGDTVTVIGCTDEWCNVKTEQMSGYIWRGCLSDNPGNLGCEAR